MSIHSDYDAFRAAARLPLTDHSARRLVRRNEPGDWRDDPHDAPLGAPGEFTPSPNEAAQTNPVDPAVPVDPVDPPDPTAPIDSGDTVV